MSSNTGHRHYLGRQTGHPARLSFLRRKDLWLRGSNTQPAVRRPVSQGCLRGSKQHCSSDPERCSDTHLFMEGKYGFSRGSLRSILGESVGTRPSELTYLEVPERLRSCFLIFGCQGSMGCGPCPVGDRAGRQATFSFGPSWCWPLQSTRDLA